MTATQVRAPSTGGQLRRDVGRVALLFTSIGSVIGSGWLLGALNATTVAGPAALISWVVGAVAILLLALIHAELGGMYHVNGGMARFPRYAFGTLVGFGMGWIYWLGSVTLAPVETEAAIQYGDKWVDKAFGFHMMHLSAGTAVLSAPGYVVAAALMLLFTVLNLWGVRRLAEANTAVVAWKIVVPVLAIVALGVSSFHPSNFTAGGFAPAGAKGILSAIATGGVTFAYLGFEQAIQFGGESRNPGRDIPFAVIGAMLVGIVIYVLLEVVFVGSIDPASLSHGWAKVSFTNEYGPFASIASGLGLGWLAVVLYIDAFLSPAGTGLIYTGASARLSYALSRSGYVPEKVGDLDARGTPWLSVIFAFVVGMIVFLPFPGWQKLVAFITSASLIIYGTQCLSAAAMRRQLPDHPRPFRLPGMGVLAPVGFVISNLIVLFAGWSTNWKTGAAIAIGYVLLAVSQLTRPASERVPLDLGAGVWLIPWIAGLLLISRLSSFTGGSDTLRFGVDMLVTAGWALAVYVVALSRRLAPQAVQERMRESEHELDG